LNKIGLKIKVASPELCHSKTPKSDGAVGGNKNSTRKSVKLKSLQKFDKKRRIAEIAKLKEMTYAGITRVGQNYLNEEKKMEKASPGSRGHLGPPGQRQGEVRQLQQKELRRNQLERVTSEATPRVTGTRPWEETHAQAEPRSPSRMEGKDKGQLRRSGRRMLKKSGEKGVLPKKKKNPKGRPKS